MKILSPKYLKTLVFPLLLLPLATAKLANAVPLPEKDGTLVVLVTWGDVENTPAKGVYVEAYGYVVKSDAYKSFVSTMVRDGRYEVSLPPGVYDIFVSDGSSEPRCRRMRIMPGGTSTWTLKLENDEVFTHF
jgi:hypothetical protein